MEHAGDWCVFAADPPQSCVKSVVKLARMYTYGSFYSFLLNFLTLVHVKFIKWSLRILLHNSNMILGRLECFLKAKQKSPHIPVQASIWRALQYPIIRILFYHFLIKNSEPLRVPMGTRSKCSDYNVWIIKCEYRYLL